MVPARFTTGGRAWEAALQAAEVAVLRTGFRLGPCGTATPAASWLPPCQPHIPEDFSTLPLFLFIPAVATAPSSPTHPLASQQAKQLASVAAKHARRLPDDIDYRAIQTLSMEAREKLSK